ncbi:MAG: multiple sugar transport system substrate-binding protein, partial [Thermosediminibacterales bacterium]|nr:multiple sugar transport system substrate-binding protein [Thermosediminibacterales bacterium]MDK2836823.1 multiple sugar transport system substrate-binding protein [Thermosediminibacterales bacterium]
MLNKKKWVVFVLMFFLLTAFTSACSLFKKSEQQFLEKSEKNWQGIITLWDYPRWPDSKGNRFHWIEEKIKEFETEIQPTFFSSPRNVENIDFNKLTKSTLQNGFL